MKQELLSFESEDLGNNPVTAREVADGIKNNINPKKAPG